MRIFVTPAELYIRGWHVQQLADLRTQTLQLRLHVLVAAFEYAQHPPWQLCSGLSHEVHWEPTPAVHPQERPFAVQKQRIRGDEDVDRSLRALGVFWLRHGRDSLFGSAGV